MSAIIYKITNTLNGKAYIGFTTKTLNERWKEHRYMASYIKRKNTHIQSAIIKYSDDVWDLQLMMEGENEEWMLRVAEPFFIALYNTYSGGYNSTVGGEGQRFSGGGMMNHFPDNVCRGEGHYLFGKSLPEETKNKISKTQCGKNNPMWKGWWNTPFGKFTTIKEASARCNVSTNAVFGRTKNKDFPDWQFIPK